MQCYVCTARPIRGLLMDKNGMYEIPVCNPHFQMLLGYLQAMQQKQIQFDLDNEDEDKKSA